VRRIEFYMRVIEKAGATGALLASGQAVTLRFPTGDRRSTQITPHDQLVDLVRDVAPPMVLNQIDSSRQARFELDSGPNRYAIDVYPQRGFWQVSIEISADAVPAAPEPVAYSESRRNVAPRAPQMTPPSAVPTAPTMMMPAATPPQQQRHPTPSSAIPTAMPQTPSGRHAVPREQSGPVPMQQARHDSGRTPQPQRRREISEVRPIVPPRQRRSSENLRQHESVSGVMPAPPPDDSAVVIIERGQYEAPKGVQTSSGSALLDLLTANARAENASDVYLIAGHAPYMKVNGQLMGTTIKSAFDPEQLSREIGIVAPVEVRTSWLERGIAGFTYSDGIGRVRVRLTRDHRGPAATFRLLMGEPPTLEDLGLYEVDNLLEDRGLILIGGPSGSGKTTTLAAMIRALGEDRRSVVVLDDVIEIVHSSPWISQRQIGMHVPDVLSGVEAAMAEGVDAIVIGSVRDGDRARAVIEAATGGHLVITTVVSPIAEVAIDRLIDKLPEAARAGARDVIQQMHLGSVAPLIGHDGSRTFEVVFGRRRA
jgi:twitching motility protein PilT